MLLIINDYSSSSIDLSPRPELCRPKTFVLRGGAWRHDGWWQGGGVGGWGQGLKWCILPSMGERSFLAFPPSFPPP